MIAIVDYGVGNLLSVHNMLAKLGFDSIVSSEKNEIAAADKLILPGVGAFGHAMDQLEQLDFRDILDDLVVRRRVPILGICLGMQLFGRGSQESASSGFGWIDADVARFDSRLLGSDERIPHMGWADVEVERDRALFSSHESTARYYFAHSYHLACDRESDVAAWCHHGYRFPAAIESGNILGVQFHPEKSHRFGMALLSRFASA